jgi:methionyl-tRNA synthetase
LAKTNPVRLRAVLWVLMDAMRHVAVVASPLMPAAAAAMLDQLAVGAEAALSRGENRLRK